MSDMDARRYNVVMNAETGTILAVYAPGGKPMTLKEIDDRLNAAPVAEEKTPMRFRLIDTFAKMIQAEDGEWVKAADVGLDGPERP